MNKMASNSRGRPVYINPEIFEGPEVSDYEGMKVQFTPGDFKFPQIREALGFVKFAEVLELFNDVRERVYAIYLNQDSRILGYRLVSSGAVDATIVDMKVIFGPAVILHAASFAVLHNHPSHKLTFSPDDKELAKRLLEVSKILGIRMLDFVVVGGNSFFSLYDDMPDLFQR